MLQWKSASKVNETSTNLENLMKQPSNGVDRAHREFVVILLVATSSTGKHDVISFGVVHRRQTSRSFLLEIIVMFGTQIVTHLVSEGQLGDLHGHLITKWRRMQEKRAHVK